MVSVKPIDTSTTGPVLAIDPAGWDELTRIPVCGAPLPSGKGCMIPAGHPGDGHARFVLALVTVEPVALKDGDTCSVCGDEGHHVDHVRHLEAERKRMIEAATGGESS